MIRPVGALRIAAEAESVRLKYQASRTANRVVMGAIALVFLIVALGFAHIAVWYWLRLSLEWSQFATAGVLGAADLVLAVILGVMAARSSPGKVELDALDVRRQAIAGLGRTVALSTLAVPVLRMLMGRMRQRR